MNDEQKYKFEDFFGSLDYGEQDLIRTDENEYFEGGKRVIKDKIEREMNRNRPEKGKDTEINEAWKRGMNEAFDFVLSVLSEKYHSKNHTKWCAMEAEGGNCDCHFIK